MCSNTVILTFIFLYCVLNQQKTWYIIVGAATCRPHLKGRNCLRKYPKTSPNMVLPTVAAAICRHPAQRAGIVVRLYLFRPTQTCLLLYYVIPFNLTGCICHGASPSPGLDGDESSPLHCAYRVLGYIIHPHRLYTPRGGRQIAAPTSTYHVFCILRTQNRR